ncbi:MAG: DUF3761 domain-containing protein [Blastocatellia bacterium]|nr:DUF3761 domain-containing protein [Blastocatellia bacterium]
MLVVVKTYIRILDEIYKQGEIQSTPKTVSPPAFTPLPVRLHPPGARAICRDGTYSFSQNRRGTCSHHGGVAQWLY